MDLRIPKIELVLSQREHDAFKERDSAGSPLPITVTQVELDAALPAGFAKNAALVCIEASRDSSASLDRIAQLRKDRPELPVIAMVREPSMSLVRALMRQGVNDIAELPVVERQLMETVADILANVRTPAQSEKKRGKLISVVKSIGGVGATNVSVNTAKALADEEPQSRICLLDLDLQFGNAATYLGAPVRPSLAELLEAGGRVDSDFLKSVATKLEAGVHFVPPPTEIGPLEAIDHDQLKHVLSLARSEFDYVFADMPSNWANWTLSVVADSDLIILVVNLTIASLRQGQRQLALMRNQGIHPDRIVVLVNRVERRMFKSIGLDDAAEALGHPVALSVHNDYALMSAANNQGVAAIAFNSKSRIAKDFAKVAEMIPALITQGG